MMVRHSTKKNAAGGFKGNMTSSQSPLKTHVYQIMPFFSRHISILVLPHTSFYFLGKKERNLSGGGHLLNLNLGHCGAGAAEVGDLGFGVLGVVVADGGFDGVFGEHGAVDWEGC
jgi:hypothetical protein